MRRFKFLIPALILLLPLAAFPQSSETGLFILSAPIRAEATIDGTPVGTTPLLIRDLSPGEHQITIVKPGHLRLTETIVVEEGGFATFSATLEPNLFVGAFAAAETEVAGTTYSRQDARLVLPAGTYEFSQSGSKLSLNPVYPNESALRGLRVATPVIVVAAVIATIEDLLVQDSARSFFTSYLPSPATFASWTAAAASTGFLLALTQDKRRYEEETVVRELDTILTDAEAELHYLDGERALEAGNLESALTNYTRVVTDGGDSEYVPLALYKSGRIYSISGESDLAFPLFELIIRDYPTPDTYDGSLKSISDIQGARGEYELAIESLMMMVYTDTALYDPAEIKDDIENLRALAAGEGGSE